MLITCPRCETVYAIPAGTIADHGRVVACGHCQHQWRAFPSLLEPGPDHADDSIAQPGSDATPAVPLPTVSETLSIAPTAPIAQPSEERQYRPAYVPPIGHARPTTVLSPPPPAKASRILLSLALSLWLIGVPLSWVAYQSEQLQQHFAWTRPWMGTLGISLSQHVRLAEVHLQALPAEASEENEQRFLWSGRIECKGTPYASPYMAIRLRDAEGTSLLQTVLRVPDSACQSGIFLLNNRMTIPKAALEHTDRIDIAAASPFDLWRLGLWFWPWS